MRFLIDVDGVVANFSKHVIDSCGSSLTENDISQWDIYSLIGETDGEAYKQYALKLMEDRHFWETIPLMPGAISGIEKIRELGHDIYWVTSPWATCIGWDVARRQWLVKNFPETTNDHIVITSAKYICSGNFFIDDKIENVTKWKKHNLNGNKLAMGLLYKAPYNMHYLDSPHFNWEKVESFLSKLDRMSNIKERYEY